MEAQPEQNQDVVLRMPMKQELLQLQEETRALFPKNDKTEQAATIVVGKAQRCMRELEIERREIAEPLEREIENKTAPYKQAATFFKQVKNEMEARLTAYRAEKARKAQEQQKKAMEKFEQQQAKAEKKAEETGEAPAPVQAPKVYSGPAKRVDTGSETVTWKSKETWVLEQFPGWDKKERIRANDPRIKALHEQHPELFILDPVLVNKAVAAGMKLPDVLTIQGEAPQVRGKS